MNLSASALAVLGDSREERGLARSPLWLVEARGHANADADANVDADANAYADAFADQPRNTTKMKNGLYAVTITQSGRTVLRVGWFRRDPSDPDEYECVWRTPYCGEYSTQRADVWMHGPIAAPHWKWGKAVPSVAHRIHIQPLARLDPEKWAELMPRPEGWEET